MKKSIHIVKNILQKAREQDNAFIIELALKDLGIVNMDLHSYNEAEFYFKELLNFLKSKDKKETRNHAISYAKLSRIYCQTNQFDKCNVFLDKALSLLKKIEF